VTILADLRRRERRPEVMDQPDLDAGRHRDALRGLERINRWTGSSRILWRPLRALATEVAPAPLRVLDVATGAGDTPLRLWRRARRAGLPALVAGCDVSPRAVAFAQRRAAEQGADVPFFECDALTGPLPADYDVLTCSLFLHHLTDEDAVCLLRRLAEAASRLVLIHDLRRGLGGFALAYLGTRLLSRSEVVHTDGPRSVRAAFTQDEALALARQAGLEGATVEKRWPCRFLLSWKRR
jgi:2-polyprenyl-3-methyl-5-hydroxy-6-metoxy-1,4-benzoquinol methylase